MVPHDNVAHNITKLREQLVQLIVSEVLTEVLDKDVSEDLLSPLVTDAILACHKESHKPVREGRQLKHTLQHLERVFPLLEETHTFLSLSNMPLTFSIAMSADSCVSKWTNPNPRELPSSFRTTYAQDNVVNTRGHIQNHLCTGDHVVNKLGGAHSEPPVYRG